MNTFLGLQILSESFSRGSQSVYVAAGRVYRGLSLITIRGRLRSRWRPPCSKPLIYWGRKKIAGKDHKQCFGPNREAAKAELHNWLASLLKNGPQPNEAGDLTLPDRSEER